MNGFSDSNPFSFARRRLKSLAIVAGLLFALMLIVHIQNQSLRHSSFTTGYLLMGCIIFLAAFNLRKKIPFLPALGSAAKWMQWHIYVGLSTFAIFGFHIGWQVPNGAFETLLAVLYLVVAFSGVYGLYLTRVMPVRLTAISEEIIFERIPAFQREIAGQARELVLKAAESSDVLAKFYVNRLVPFLERPRNLGYLICPTGRYRRVLVGELQDLDRYLSRDQRACSRMLSDIVQKKDDLDFHYAIQGRLKVWLFVHIGLTYSLLIVSLLHAIMAHAFAGGLR